MKAVVYDQHGPIENLKIATVGDPAPGPDECLLQVEAVALNNFDPVIMRGVPGVKTPLPMTPGGGIAGKIVALGSGVPSTAWRVGDRVVVNPVQKKGMVGETLVGGMSEMFATPAEALIKLPPAISSIDAAALPVSYSLALRMVGERGHLKAGEKVLVLSAGGGVGAACVQLALDIGCKVVACARGAAKVARLKELGAHHVIDSATQDFVEIVRGIYGKPHPRGGGGVDVLINNTGGDTWTKGFRVLTRHGRLLTSGAADRPDPQTDIRYIRSFEFNILGVNGWSSDDISELVARVASGRLKPAIHATRPFSAVRQSMQELVDRQVFGKSVLVPG